MAQVSVPPSSAPLPSDEFNDEPVTPTSVRWTDDQAPLRTASPEPLPPSPPPKWKGKQREIVPTYDDQPVSSVVREVDLGRASLEQEIYEAPTESLVASTYPPAAEEAVEERKVNETLKRWEQLERQRRKAARERLSNDSTTSTSQPSAIRSDINSRGSLFWASAKSRKPAPGSHPLSTADAEGDRSPSAEDFSLPPESEEVAVVPVRPPDDLTKARESFIARHEHSSSLDSHGTGSSAATVTPSDPQNLPVASVISTLSNPDPDPFADPAARSRTRKGKQTPRTVSRTSTGSSDPFADGNPGEDDTPHIPPHQPTAGSLGLRRPPRYPTPQPLGLPLTAIYNPTGSPPDYPSRRQRRPDGDDDDGPAEVGRWWTDWLCGCREAGDNQAAKTNPFE